MNGESVCICISVSLLAFHIQMKVSKTFFKENGNGASFRQSWDQGECWLCSSILSLLCSSQILLFDNSSSPLETVCCAEGIVWRTARAENSGPETWSPDIHLQLVEAISAGEDVDWAEGAARCGPNQEWRPMLPGGRQKLAGHWNETDSAIDTYYVQGLRKGSDFSKPQFSHIQDEDAFHQLWKSWWFVCKVHDTSGQWSTITQHLLGAEHYSISTYYSISRVIPKLYTPWILTTALWCRCFYYTRTRSQKCWLTSL